MRFGKPKIVLLWQFKNVGIIAHSYSVIALQHYKQNSITNGSLILIGWAKFKAVVNDSTNLSVTNLIL